MSVFLNELKPMKMYRTDFIYPIDKESRKSNSIVYLVTPNRESTINTILHPKAERNKTLFKSYFLEKNVELILKTSDKNTLKESFELNKCLGLTEDTDLEFEDNRLSFTNDEGDLYRVFMAEDADRYINSEENHILTEDRFVTKYGSYDLTKIFRDLLYTNRIKTQGEVLKIYKSIKEKIPFIKYTYVDPKIYKNKNLYYDWSYYTELFLKNQTKFTNDKGVDILFAYLSRFLSSSTFETYTKRTIVIPVHDWIAKNTKDKMDVLDYKKSINPLSMFYRNLRINHERYNTKEWLDSNILFLGKDTYIPFSMKDYLDKPNFAKFSNIISKLISNNIDEVIEITNDSKDVILNNLIDKVEKSGITLDNMTGGTHYLTKEDIKDSGLLNSSDPTVDTDKVEVKKALLINKLEKVASGSSTTKDALETLDSDENKNDLDMEKIKDLLMDIQSEDGIKMNKARSDRMEKTRKDFLNKEIKGISVGKLLDQFETDTEMPEIELPIDTIDESWKHLKFPNFNKLYTQKDMNADILAMFHHFAYVTHPMNILDIDFENTSTSEDYINTWTCKYEDAENGKRFTMKLDIPLLIGNRFMKLRGNEKVLLGQLMLLPIVKTNEDEVQMVSNYNKIFIRRKSPSGFSKSTPIINKLCKALDKYEGKDFKVKEGSNAKVCSRYELPIDFVDIASLYAYIEFKDKSYISFNMDTLSKIPIDRDLLPFDEQKLDENILDKKYMAIYVNSKGKREPIIGVGVDRYILEKICKYDKSGEFSALYDKATVAKRLMFSEASILNMKIPVIAVLAYNIGLTAVMKKANIDFYISDKRPTDCTNYIIFKDGYLAYNSTGEETDLLMNGLMQFDCKEYSITEINSKDMWLGVLDEFGGRIKADGLDNFYDLMMDPITVEICKTIHIPSNYVEAMIYANNLLVDNKYNKHSDITGNRLRVNEIIVGHLYHVLANAFGDYRNIIKRSNSASFSAKQSAVIDSIMNHDQTSSDLSTLTPLLEAESAGKVTFKGLSGMNSDRAFSIDKRTFDKSMLGIVGLSTGFASSVGINRQLTIDSSVRSKRGFFVPKKPDELNNTNTLSMMECLSPMALNHDDPFRTAMAFTQTSQHQMTVKKSMPMLVTAGADEALPYLTSNKFSYKFEGDSGVVKEMTDEYIIIEDNKTKEKQFIDIRETIRKNSDGGFYITTKLTPNSNIKVGTKLKKNDIIAYDKGNYSNAIGNGNGKNPNNIAYNLGTIGKVAIMNTDLGFEDSCVVDSYISDALSSDICFQKEINLDKNSNIYNLVEIGQTVQADDPLLVFQDAFDEKDANDLLRAISMDQDELSDIGRKHIRSKVAGVIQDIKIFRTCDIDQLSPTLQKVVKDYENRINKLKRVMSKNDIHEEYTLEPTKKLPKEGKLKNVDGVRIEIYIKTGDIFSCGDKLVFYQALKGVCSYIIPKGKEAYTDFRPKESVNSFLTINGVMGRMVPSALTLGLTFKLMIELSRQCQEELGIEWKQLQDILSEEN